MKKGLVKKIATFALVLALAIVVVRAFGTADPTIFGHSLSELAPGTFNNGTYNFPTGTTLNITSNLSIGNTITYVAPGTSTDIQNAIDSLPNGGIVVLQRGIYTISSPITLKDNITLQGSGHGTILKATTGSINVIQDDSAQAEQVTLKNFEIDANGQTSVRGVDLNNATGIIEGLSIKGAQYGIRVDNSVSSASLKDRTMTIIGNVINTTSGGVYGIEIRGNLPTARTATKAISNNIIGSFS
ncbi:hypothetical protein D6825_00330, partial [Candidatus Woesearchaeota archaeon]